MTRYLTRDPIKGDRVRVEYEATVSFYGTAQAYVVVVPDVGPISQAPIGAVRVIAPEPKVGDVVTADMDLPHRSVAEGKSGWLCAAMYDASAKEWVYNSDRLTSEQLARHYAQPWRIVRIGGASDV